MKKSFTFIVGVILTAVFDFSQSPPFTKGVNLYGWFCDVSHATQIQNNKFTKNDFKQIRSLGCDVIRLPIDLHKMTYGAPDYVIDSILFTFLDRAVGWAEDLGIYLILDNQSFDPNINTDPSIENVLLKVWSQMADHYKDRSDFVIYEILNEPHGISDVQWGQIQQHVIDIIRESDGSHKIIIGGSGNNGYRNLQNLPLYTDTNLISFLRSLYFYSSGCSL